MQSQDPPIREVDQKMQNAAEAAESEASDFYANDDKTVNSPIGSINFNVGDQAPERSWEESKMVRKVLNNLASVQNWSKIALTDENWTNILAGLKKLAQQDQDFA